MFVYFSQNKAESIVQNNEKSFAINFLHLMLDFLIVKF